MKKTIALVSAAFIFVVFPVFLFADEESSFRCADDLIQPGYSMVQVQNSCGAPDSQMVVGQPSETGVIVVQWVYKRDFGVYVLTFAGSKVVKIEYQKLD